MTRTLIITAATEVAALSQAIDLALERGLVITGAPVDTGRFNRRWPSQRQWQVPVSDGAAAHDQQPDTIEGVTPPAGRTAECRQCGTVVPVSTMSVGLCEECTSAWDDPNVVGDPDSTPADPLTRALGRIDAEWTLPAEERDALVAAVRRPRLVEQGRDGTWGYSEAGARMVNAMQATGRASTDWPTLLLTALVQEEVRQ
jgi:hypothetical protein